MCKIKSGRSISNNEDVRNLITGIILRQNKAYYKEKIVKQVSDYMKGASISLSDKEINHLVDNSLDIFSRNDEVDCFNGRYTTMGL